MGCVRKFVIYESQVIKGFDFVEDKKSLRPYRNPPGKSSGSQPQSDHTICSGKVTGMVSLSDVSSDGGYSFCNSCLARLSLIPTRKCGRQHKAALAQGSEPTLGLQGHPAKVIQKTVAPCDSALGTCTVSMSTNIVSVHRHRPDAG